MPEGSWRDMLSAEEMSGEASRLLSKVHFPGNRPLQFTLQVPTSKKGQTLSQKIQ